VAFPQEIEPILEGALGFFQPFREAVYSLLAENAKGAALVAVFLGAMLAWLIVRVIYRRSRTSRTHRAADAASSGLAVSQIADQQYQALYQSSPVPTFICDTRKWRFLEVNEAATREYGYSRKELLKMTLLELGLPEDAERLAETVAGLAPSSGELGTWTHRKKDGTAIEAEMVSYRLQFARRQAHVVIARDVTRRQHTHDVLRQDLERFSLASKGTTDAMLDWDLISDKLWQSDNYAQVFGSDARQTGTDMASWFEQIHPDDRARVQELLLNTIKSTSNQWVDEFRLLRKGQKVTHVLARGHITRAQDGTPRRLVCVLQDVTERKEQEERTRFLADHDELTELPNRSLFRQSLNKALQRAERSGKMLSILFFDLDRFKNINDSLGHDAGDEVLRVVAERLVACVRKIDVVARFGGDEFAVLTEGLTAEDQASAVARKILEVLSKPMILAGRQYRPAASIGISTYPTDGRDAQSLLKNADIAMYRAKEEGRGAFQFYSEQLNTHSVQRLEFESNLNNALNNHEFLLYYQPKVDMATGRITGLEALIRWISPQFGFVPPADFISIAEETGLIVPLGRWVAQTACVQNRAWQKGGLPPMRIAINISARQMADKGLVKFISESVQQTGLTAESLELEITESAVMSNQEDAERMLSELKKLGFHLTMDDFGTGYSSLAYLKRFPFDSVKIDQSFVSGIPESKDDEAIVEAIIAMAHSLQLEVVAEGVETRQQFEFLRRLGCDQIQGYYFSKPIPSNEIVVMLYKTMTREAGANVLISQLDPSGDPVAAAQGETGASDHRAGGADVPAANDGTGTSR
jgi:diguanylate cyclase (GGDEF)-like protein/PAS domain S-box-containing protein